MKINVQISEKEMEIPRGKLRMIKLFFGLGNGVSGFWFLVSELQCFRVTGKSALIRIFSVIRVLIVCELQCYRVSDPS